MCGIFGWNLKEGQLSNTKRKQLYDLLVLQNDSRGGHSWGVCAVDRTTQTPIVERGLGTMFPARHKDILPWKQDTMFGHTRFKTHGDAVVENAHPFEIGNVIGAHNGVLSNHFELNREFNRDFKVDSQHIFAHIDEGQKFKSLEGYGAIEYVFKTNPNSVYLGTFDHYLSVWRILDGKDSVGIVWTSDDKHAKFALKMARLEVEELKIEDRTVYVVENADSFRTKLKMNVAKTAQKWDWRRGEVVGTSGYSGSYNPHGSGFRGHDYKTTTIYRTYEQKALPETTTPATEPNASEADKSCKRSHETSHGNLQDIKTLDVFYQSYCEYCFEKNEDCCCNKAFEEMDQNLMECPDCEQGWAEGRSTTGHLDYFKCQTCKGQGVIVDPAFAVEDGHNDRIKSC